MDYVMGGLPVWAFALAILVAGFAGFVKGAIGFAFPLIMIAVLPSFMPTQTALAALILPVLVTNLHQSLRGGLGAAWASACKFWRIIVACMAGIAISAPFAVILPQRVMFGLLGGAVLGFSILQLRGWVPVIATGWRKRAELIAGMVSGLYGGISGVWGPPVIVFLLAANVEKREMVRVLNVIFTGGAVILLIMHVRTGILNAQTAPLSASMLLPATLGLMLGFRVQDRLDADRFRIWTLIALCLGALNLLRRAVMG